MKRIAIYLFALLFIGSTTTAQVKPDTLTNAKIIQLTKIGLAPSILINKIKTSVNVFDVSTDALINLSNNKVATEVINEMMKISEVVTTKIQASSNDPAVMHNQGIYFYNPGDAANPLQRVDAGIVSGYHSSGGGYGGFGGASQMADLSGSESMMKIKERQPAFYFYFDKNTINRGADWFEVSSPKEFILVNLMVKKGNRFFRVGSSSYTYGMDNSHSGIPQKDQILFEYIQVADGIYKITPKSSLKSGEYCFVLASNTRKVFDFAIQ